MNLKYISILWEFKQVNNAMETSRKYTMFMFKES